GLSFPGVDEGVSYGTPALRVAGKLMVRLREDGDSLVLLKVDFLEREMMMNADPDVFYITEHYRNYPSVLVRLSKVRRDELRALPEQTWRRLAPKRLVLTFDGEAPPASRAKRRSGPRPR